MDYKIGDFTGVQESKPDGNITKEDVQLFLNGMKTGLFLNKHQTEFHISNTFQKSPYMGPSFREILKLDCKVEEGGGTFGDDESEELDDLVGPSNTDDVEIEISEIVDDSLVHFGEKGSAIDTYLETIVASVPNAKIKNFFHKSGDATTPVEKNIGYVKIYSFADKLDYSEYDIVLPPVFTNRDEESVPHDLEFGKESVAIYGDFLAVSAFYSRPKADEFNEQNPSAKIFIYKKYEGTETNDPGYKFYTVIEDYEFGVEPVLEIHEDLLFASDYRFNFIKVYSLEKLSTLNNYETAIPLSKIVPVDLIKPLNGDDFNSEWGRSLVCRDGLNLFVGAPNAIVSYGAPISTGVVQHYALNQSDALTDADGTQPNPWKFIQTISLPQSTIPYWASDEKQWYDFHNAYKDGNPEYKDESPQTAGSGWGINDDLGAYFEEEELPPFTCAYYLVADTRMGETIDFRNQKDSQNQIDKGRTYLTVGCPNYFDETVPNVEPSAKDGCAVIFDVSLTYTDITSIQGGEHQLINRIMPSSASAVKAMEVGSSPGIHFDCDDVSVHIQSELPSQEDLINRGSPLFWDDHTNSLTYSEVTHGNNSGLLLHSAPYAKSYIKIGQGGGTDDAKLGDISLQEQPSYLLNDDDLTLEFWYRAQNSNGDTEQFVVGTNDGSESPDSSANAWKLTFNTDTNKFTFLYKNSSYQFTKESNNEFNNTSWNHIAIVHENNPKSSSEGITENTRTLNLYVNGVQQLSDNTIEYAQTIVNSDAGTYLSFAGLKNSSNTFVTGQSCYIDDIRITHGIRYTEAFDRPVSCFAICYFPKGFGASVSMDANYDVYALDNHTGGFISKYERLVSSENTSVSWSFREKVSLSKDEPVVGGMTSIYSLDLVYGNKNDLRIYPRNSTIGIHEGENENSPKDIDLSYTISGITAPYDYSVMLKGKGIIDWGDGTQESFDFQDGFRKLAHRYETSAENFVIKIYGVTGWGESEGADSGQSKVTQVNKISENITELDGAFKGATDFNQDISGWNTTNITSMKNLFNGATSFNQDLSNWNVENVTDMSGMFNGASAFNSDLSEWCVSSLNEQSNFSTDSSLISEQIPSWGTCNNYIDFYFNTTSLTAPLVIPFTSTTDIDSTGYDLTITWGDDDPEVFSVGNLEASLSNFANGKTTETISALYPTKANDIPSNSNYKVRLALPDVPCKLNNIEDVEGDMGPEFPSTLFTSPTKIMVKRGDSLVELDCGNYESLQEVDLSKAILSSIEHLGFSHCTHLNSIIWPSEIDCTNIDSFRYLFYGCDILTDISLENFKNTENVYDATGMFENCSLLTTLDLADFTGENLLYSTSMFRGTKLSTINGQKFNTRKIKNADSMFAEMPNFKVFTFGEDWNFDNLESANHMFGFQNKPSFLPTRFIGSMVNEMGTLPKIKSLNGFFKNQVNIQYLGWKTNEPPTFENVTDMTEMYYGVNAVERDILSHTFSKANTINLTKINGMLGCEDASGAQWYAIDGGDDATKVISDVLEIVANALNTDKVTSAVGFLQNQINLKEFDVSLNLTNATDLSFFFDNCIILEKIKFSHGFVASELNNADGMFQNCKGGNGTKIDFSFLRYWNTTKLVSTRQMFKQARFTSNYKNSEDTISFWDVQNLKYAQEMFASSVFFNDKLDFWCTNSIEDHTDFSSSSSLQDNHLPVWNAEDNISCSSDFIYIDTGDPFLVTKIFKLRLFVGTGGATIQWNTDEEPETQYTEGFHYIEKDLKNGTGYVYITGDVKSVVFNTIVPATAQSLPSNDFSWLEEGRNVTFSESKYYDRNDGKHSYFWDQSTYSSFDNQFNSDENPIEKIYIRGMSTIVSTDYMFGNLGNITEKIDISQFDASNVYSSKYMFTKSNIKSEFIQSDILKTILGKTYDVNGMFHMSQIEYTEDTNIDLDMPNVLTIAGMMHNSYHELEDGNASISYDINFNLNVPKCKFAKSAFSMLSLGNLNAEINIQNSNDLFDISNILQYCTSDNFNLNFKTTDGILASSNAFEGTGNAIYSGKYELNIINDFKNLLYAKEMFKNSFFKEIQASNFIGSKIKDTSYMFSNTEAKIINLPEFSPRVEEMEHMFANSSELTHISAPKFSYGGLKHSVARNYCRDTFNGCKKLVSLHFSNSWINLFGKNSTVHFQNTFRDCEEFNDRRITNWDTSSVRELTGFFANCFKLNMPIQKWDISNCLTFSYMFLNCKSFNHNLNDWDIAGTTKLVNRKIGKNEPLNFSQMFDGATSFDRKLSSWPNKIKYFYNNMHNVFSKTIFSSQDVSTMTVAESSTPKWIVCDSMFNNCQNLANLSITDWKDIPKYASIVNMFKNCAKLKNDDFSELNWHSYVEPSSDLLTGLVDGIALSDNNKPKGNGTHTYDSEIDIHISGTSAFNFIIESKTTDFTIDWGDGQGDQTISCEANTPKFIYKDYGEAAEDEIIIKIKGSILIRGVVRKLFGIDLIESAWENLSHPYNPIKDSDEFEEWKSINVTYIDNHGMNRAIFKVVNRGDALNLCSLFKFANYTNEMIESVNVSLLDYSAADFSNLMIAIPIYGTPQVPNTTFNEKYNTRINGNRSSIVNLSIFSTTGSSIAIEILVPDNFDLDSLLEESISIHNLFANTNITNIDDIIGDSKFKENIDKEGMFSGCRNLPSNEKLAQIDMSNTKNISYMLSGVQLDNCDLSSWDVNNVQQSVGLFSNTTFNSDPNISNWNFKTLFNASRMFYNSNFNYNISNWNVSNLVEAFQMFNNSSFDKNISNWKLSNLISAVDMLKGSSLINFPYTENKVRYPTIDSSCADGTDFSKATRLDVYGNIDIQKFKLPYYFKSLNINNADESDSYPHDLSSLKVGQIEQFSISKPGPDEKLPRLLQLHKRGVIQSLAADYGTTILLEFVSGITEFEFEVTHSDSIKVYWNPTEEPETFSGANSNIRYSKSQSSDFDNIVIQGKISHISFKPGTEGESNGIKFALVHDHHNTLRSYKSMFEDCDVLEDVDMTGCAVIHNSASNEAQTMLSESVRRNASRMFYGCKNLINVSFSSPKKIEYNIFDHASDDVRLNDVAHTIGHVTDASYMFFGCEKIENISYEGASFNMCNNFSNMVSGCKELTNIVFPSDSYEYYYNNTYIPDSIVQRYNVNPTNELNRFNTRDFSQMFDGCSKLTDVDLSFLGQTVVHNAQYMFRDNKIITELNVENFDLRSDTDELVSIQHMFDGCTNLNKVVGLDEWNTEDLFNIHMLFRGCGSLVDIKINDWNVKNVKQFGGFLYECNSLTKINLSKWCTKNYVNNENWCSEPLLSLLSKHPRWGECPERQNTETSVNIIELPPTPTPSVSASYTVSASFSIVKESTPWPDENAEGVNDEDFIVGASTFGDSGRIPWTIGAIVADNNIGWLNEVFPDGNVHENFRTVENVVTYGSQRDYDVFAIFNTHEQTYVEYHYLENETDGFIPGWYRETIGSADQKHLDFGQNYKNDGKEESLYSNVQNMSEYFLSDNPVRKHFIGGKHLLGNEATQTLISDWSSEDAHTKVTEFNGKNYFHSRFCTSQGPLFAQSYFTIFRGKHSSEQFAGGPIDLREIDFKTNTSLYLTKAFADPCNS